MPPSRTTTSKTKEAIKNTSPIKAKVTERTHEENQERAYIAASRRSDRSLEARMESAKRASEIHKQRTGRSLRVTEEDVINEEMYEEEEDDLPMQYQRLTAHLHTSSYEFRRRLGEYVATQVAMRTAMQLSQHTQNGQNGQNGQDIESMQQGYPQYIPQQYYGAPLLPMFPSPMEVQQHMAQQQAQFLPPGQSYFPVYPTAPYATPSSQMPLFSPFSTQQPSTIAQFQQGQLNMMQAGSPVAEFGGSQPSALFTQGDQLLLGQTGAAAMSPATMNERANTPRGSQPRSNPPADQTTTFAAYQSTSHTDAVDSFIAPNPSEPAQNQPQDQTTLTNIRNTNYINERSLGSLIGSPGANPAPGNNSPGSLPQDVGLNMMLPSLEPSSDECGDNDSWSVFIHDTEQWGTFPHHQAKR